MLFSQIQVEFFFYKKMKQNSSCFSREIQVQIALSKLLCNNEETRKINHKTEE